MSQSKTTAIVIDDDKDTVSVLSDFLRIKGIQVVGEGYDGAEAVEIYKKFRPDIVFLDVMMDKYDGFYGLVKIRDIKKDAIVIMVTADMTVETESMLTKLNASTLIYKPYDINKIMEIIKKLTLEKTSQTKQVSSIHV
ncbi:MAG TPA: response regulator [Candidatus Nitrosotalea sp.]|nr:response regulator [Candidatus Nitrosotalea sp.]